MKFIMTIYSDEQNFRNINIKLDRVSDKIILIRILNLVQVGGLDQKSFKLWFRWE